MVQVSSLLVHVEVCTLRHETVTKATNTYTAKILHSQILYRCIRETCLYFTN